MEGPVEVGWFHLSRPDPYILISAGALKNALSAGPMAQWGALGARLAQRDGSTSGYPFEADGERKIPSQAMRGVPVEAIFCKVFAQSVSVIG